MSPKRKSKSGKSQRVLKRPSRSTKGALIKGMTHKLPRQLLVNVAFRKALKEIMRGHSGVYALYKGKRLYYVGLARNLFWRLHHHGHDRHRGKWDSFRFFRIKRIGYLKDIETIILNLIPVPGNTVIGKVPKAADLNPLIKRMLRQQSREFQEIERALTKLR